jgi:hypothetical protein
VFVPVDEAAASDNVKADQQSDDSYKASNPPASESEDSQHQPSQKIAKPDEIP